MLTAIITLPEGFTTDILGYVGQLFTDLSDYITLIVGVILALLVVSWIISMLKPK